jgi:sialate O-acetylesterase
MSGAALDQEPDLKEEKDGVIAKLSAPKKGKGIPPQETPTFYHNQMIHPLHRMALKGFIWYQGESHFNQEAMYVRAFPGLIRDWRSGFGQGDLPFYYCQLPNIEKKEADPAAEGWIAGIREAQDRTLKEPATGQAVLIDVGGEDLHPTNKKIVGERLALLAESHTYGRKVSSDSPRYISHQKKEGGRVMVRFSNCDDSLVARPVAKEDLAASGVIPESEVQGFAIRGHDGGWRWAHAAIKDGSVEVWSPDVPSPAAVRYAWANNPTCNLFNKAGLPAAPVRIEF